MDTYDALEEPCRSRLLTRKGLLLIIGWCSDYDHKERYTAKTVAAVRHLLIFELVGFPLLKFLWHVSISVGLDNAEMTLFWKRALCIYLVHKMIDRLL